jgi:hypothetical protein
MGWKIEVGTGRVIDRGQFKEMVFLTTRRSPIALRVGQKHAMAKHREGCLRPWNLALLASPTANANTKIFLN